MFFLTHKKMEAQFSSLSSLLSGEICKSMLEQKDVSDRRKLSKGINFSCNTLFASKIRHLFL